MSLGIFEYSVIELKPFPETGDQNNYCILKINFDDFKKVLNSLSGL